MNRPSRAGACPGSRCLGLGDCSCSRGMCQLQGQWRQLARMRLVSGSIFHCESRQTDTSSSGRTPERSQMSNLALQFNLPGRRGHVAIDLAWPEATNSTPEPTSDTTCCARAAGLTLESADADPCRSRRLATWCGELPNLIIPSSHAPHRCDARHGFDAGC